MEHNQQDYTAHKTHLISVLLCFLCQTEKGFRSIMWANPFYRVQKKILIFFFTKQNLSLVMGLLYSGYSTYTTYMCFTSAALRTKIYSVNLRVSSESQRGWVEQINTDRLTQSLKLLLHWTQSEMYL